MYLVPVLVPVLAGFFSASHYREKGTSAVFKEQGWEENPTDSICLMTALVHSL